MHDGRDAVIVVRRHAVVVCGFRFRLGIVGLFLFPLREFAFQTVCLRLVCVVLLTVGRRILDACRTDFFQQDSVLVFQCPDSCFKIGDLTVRLIQQRIQFRKVEVIFRHRGLHGALLGMGVQRTTAFTALVLCRTLSERNPVGTGHADGHALASLQFGGVRCLVIVPRTGRYIIGVAVLVFVELRKPDIQLRPKRVQVHRVGIEDFLIDDLFFVPAFAHMDFVCVCLFGLLVFLADDVSTHPIVDAVVEPVVLVVQLSHAASRPAGISFRIGKYLFPLRGVGIEIRVARVEPHPCAPVQDAVVVRRRIVVAQRYAPLVTPGNVPPLRVIVPHRFVQVVGHPRRKIVVAEVEQTGYVIRTTHHVNQQAADVMFRLLE